VQRVKPVHRSDGRIHGPVEPQVQVARVGRLRRVDRDPFAAAVEEADAGLGVEKECLVEHSPGRFAGLYRAQARVDATTANRSLTRHQGERRMLEGRGERGLRQGRVSGG